MIDAEIVENGTLTTGSGNYVQYNMLGTMTLTGSNGVTTVYSGVYQIGGIWSGDGTLYVTHHFFAPTY
jgi:hypothetical protein